MHDSLLMYLVIYVVIFNNGRSRHELTACKCLTKTRGICLTLSFFTAKEKKGTESVTICNFYEIMIKEACSSFWHYEEFSAVSLIVRAL